MTAQDLKNTITDENIIFLLNILGTDIYYEDEKVIIFDETICHNGHSHKLYYYKDNKQFFCYSECGHLSIIDLVIKVLNLETGDNEKDCQKAINWICLKLNINQNKYGQFGITDNVNNLSDFSFINNIKKKIKLSKCIKDITTSNDIKILNNNILNIFQQYYSIEWINDGISINTMIKYNILFCVWKQEIIIPHYDVDNNLIGVRGRYLLESDIDIYGKYSPFRYSQFDKCFYNHQLGKNLYGLNLNKNAIKRKQKIMLVEAEKSVMQADSMFGDDNFVVALCGSNLTDYQRFLILNSGAKEVIIAMDKQYEKVGTEEYEKWLNKLKTKMICKLIQYINVSVLWDMNDILGYKDSPTDCGKDKLLELMDKKIIVTTDNFLYKTE